MANLTEKNDILNLELREKLKEKFDKLKEPKKYIFKKIFNKKKSKCEFYPNL